MYTAKKNVTSGLRSYNPHLGRWINRDPIGEQGGTNLMGFVGNGPTGYWDYLGNDWFLLQLVNNPGSERAVEIVRKEGELAADATRQARKTIVETDLTFARGAVIDVQTRGHYVVNKQLANHVAGLSKPGRKIYVPTRLVSEVSQGALDILSFTTWIMGDDEKRTREQLIDAVAKFKEERNYSNCIGVCLTALEYIEEMEVASELAKGGVKFFVKNRLCLEGCCNLKKKKAK